jgi:hypothetical protein
LGVAADVPDGNDVVEQHATPAALPAEVGHLHSSSSSCNHHKCEMSSDPAPVLCSGSVILHYITTHDPLKRRVGTPFKSQREAHRGLLSAGHHACLAASHIATDHGVRATCVLPCICRQDAFKPQPASITYSQMRLYMHTLPRAPTVAAA